MTYPFVGPVEVPTPTSGTHPTTKDYVDTAVATKQTADSDLTTIAGLTATTDNVIQSVSSAWASRTPAQLKATLALAKADVGLGSVDNVQQQPLDSDLTTIAGLTATSDNFLQSKSSAWASRTPAQVAADLVSPLGSSFQPLDSDLTAIAGLTATTDNVIQSVSSAWASRTPAQLKATLALAKGDVGLGNVDNVQQQPLDSDLTTIAGLTATTDNFLQSKASAWASRTPTQVAADLVTPLSSSLQPIDSDLTTIAGLTATTDSFMQAKSSAWSARTIAQVRTDLTVIKDWPPVVVTYAATVSINAALGTHFRITATGACQLLATTNATDGQVMVVEFNASGGARTLSLLVTATSQAFVFGSDITALTATASGKTDLVQFVYNSTAARWWPIAYVKGF